MGVQAALSFTLSPPTGAPLGLGHPLPAGPWSAKRLGQEYRVGVGAF